MMTTEDIPENLYNYLLTLPKQELLNIMLEALDEMKGFNGNSYIHCICTAAGFEETKQGVWRIPA